MNKIPQQVKSVGTKNNSVVYITFGEKIVTVTIFYGSHHKTYEIEHGDTDIYLGKFNSVRYYLNLNNGENEVYCNHPFTCEPMFLSKCEQDRVLKAIICNS